jgi:tetratricopeptide (TPR) repeat protein
VYYDEAYTLGVKLGNRYSQSLILNNIGTVNFSQKNYEKAEEVYLKSLEICREIDDREGEAIALSNLGELFTDKGDFKNGVDYNQKALTICQEIGSDWGEMSARSILAWGYRELTNVQAAIAEVLIVLQRSLDLEFFYFFYRGVVEACWLLLKRGKTNGLQQIIKVIVDDEESDDWIRSKAAELMQILPEDHIPTSSDMDLAEIQKFLLHALQQ